MRFSTAERHGRTVCLASRAARSRLEDLHSALRQTFETLKGLILLASPRDSKPTQFETFGALTITSAGSLFVGVFGQGCCRLQVEISPGGESAPGSGPELKMVL
jgi:hypothetical protein